ncbi:MAG: DEAD/DEAH box helicase family protein [Dehalococcoidia bacterium]
MKSKVSKWRSANYASDYPAIGEILDYNYDPETQNFRYLRKAQFEALETYWYLRLKEDTPHIFNLYRKLFSPSDLLDSLGIRLTPEDLTKLLINGGGIDSIFEKIKSDDAFVKKYKLEAVRETLTLAYPSYILALAMGAGKTVLIGTIIATEFAMALEYPDGPFVNNALVFAPGKTILGALKELSDIPFEKLLPQRLYKQFITTVKFTYTRDGEKDIPIIKESRFNLVVTNTEKIRIQKQSITKSLIRGLFTDPSKEDEIKQEVANQRLQTLASLPNLAIFSDEAHHTYGMALGEELKKVRKTVDYLAKGTNVLVVINTTGTPYYGRQILKDVVYWYGLSQGINDGILKEVRDNIVGYEDIGDDVFLTDLIVDFFKNYKDVKIYDNSPAKLAIYFPQIEDIAPAKLAIEQTLVDIGLDPSILLEVHNKSPDDVKDFFDNRINDPHIPYRIFLLVNKGTEGWNCLSLFATALARRLTTSNNFVLQAASRCLRQTAGNTYKAKIYLSKDNVNILDAQLKETYGESLQILNNTPQDIRKELLVLRKVEIPPILLKKKVSKVVPAQKQTNFAEIQLQKPDVKGQELRRIIYDLKDIADKKGVLIRKSEEEIVMEEDFVDTYTFAVELSTLYRLPLMPIYERLKSLYPDDEIPQSHINKIRNQLEEQVRNYQVTEEEVEVALALIRPSGFDKETKDNQTIYTAEIVYHKDRENLLRRYEAFKQSNRSWYQLEFGFHYSPYNFDSNPEVDLFLEMLRILNENPADIEDVYFTGAITDPNKTDFLFEYKGKDERWHTYTPDFLIRKKNGKVLIIEVKMEKFKSDEVDGEKGLKALKLQEIQGLNPDKIKYEMLFTSKDEIGFANVNKIKEAIYEYKVSKNA